MLLVCIDAMINYVVGKAQKGYRTGVVLRTGVRNSLYDHECNNIAKYKRGRCLFMITPPIPPSVECQVSSVRRVSVECPSSDLRVTSSVCRRALGGMLGGTLGGTLAERSAGLLGEHARWALGRIAPRACSVALDGISGVAKFKYRCIKLLLTHYFASVTIRGQPCISRSTISARTGHYHSAHTTLGTYH